MHDLRLEQLMLELIKFGLEVLCPRDVVGPRHLVEGVSDKREGWNQIAIVVAEPEK